MSEQRSNLPLISIIIPVFNEEAAVANCITVVDKALSAHNLNYQILFVNDGSNDATLEQLLTISQTNTRILVLNLSRNFGKDSALTAGIDAAEGDVLIPMDVDLQDPPELIPQFIAKWREGYDVVYGIRMNREADTAIKRTSANWFYRLFNGISSIKIPENVGDFRLIDRRVAEVLKRLPERNRFMKGLFAWVGFQSIGIPYVRPARTLGTTKWNYWQLWNFAIDGVVSFSTLPLRFWSYLGGLVAGVSIVYALFIIARVILTGVDIPGYASLMSAVLFIGGIQIFSIGIIGEYLGRLFIEVKGRPIYIVEGRYRNGTRNAASILRDEFLDTPKDLTNQ